MSSDLQTIPIATFLRQERQAADWVVIDLRDPMAFAAAHLPDALCIAAETFDASLLPPGLHWALMGTQEAAKAFLHAQEAAKRPAATAWLQGDIRDWQQAGGQISLCITIASDELAMDLPHDERILLLDVRPEEAFDEGHVRDAVSLPLASLTDPGSMALLEEDCNIYIYGTDAAEALLAASLIMRQGYHNLRALEEGWEVIRSQPGIPVEKSAGHLN